MQPLLIGTVKGSRWGESYPPCTGGITYFLPEAAVFWHLTEDLLLLGTVALAVPGIVRRLTATCHLGSFRGFAFGHHSTYRPCTVSKLELRKNFQKLVKAVADGLCDLAASNRLVLESMNA
jgi:hypothetical protein